MSRQYGLMQTEKQTSQSLLHVVKKLLSELKWVTFAKIPVSSIIYSTFLMFSIGVGRNKNGLISCTSVNGKMIDGLDDRTLHAFTAICFVRCIKLITCILCIETLSKCHTLPCKLELYTQFYSKRNP